MRVLSTFVSALSICSRGTNNVEISKLSCDKEYPVMLQCGPRGECPEGSMCMKLVGKYGVCVVQGR